MWELKVLSIQTDDGCVLEDEITNDGKTVYAGPHRYKTVEEFLLQQFNSIRFYATYKKSEGWSERENLSYIDVSEHYYKEYLMVTIRLKHDKSIARREVYELYNPEDSLDDYLRLNNSKAKEVRDALMRQTGELPLDMRQISVTHHKEGNSLVEIRPRDFCVYAPQSGCNISEYEERYLADVEVKWTEECVTIICHFLSEQEKSSFCYTMGFKDGFPALLSKKEIPTLSWMEGINSKYEMVQNPYNDNTQIQPPKYKGDSLFISAMDDCWVRMGDVWVVIPEDSILSSRLSDPIKSEYCMYQGLVL